MREFALVEMVGEGNREAYITKPQTDEPMLVERQYRFTGTLPEPRDSTKHRQGHEASALCLQLRIHWRVAPIASPRQI